MKNVMKWAFVGAAVLAIVACQKEKSSVDDPLKDPTKQEVNTQFVFNVSTTNTQSKQTAAATQATTTNAFLGIDNAVLMTSFIEGNDGKILTADQVMDKSYDLAALISPATVSAELSRRVLEMSLPLKTNTLVFYGKAPTQTNGIDGFSVAESYGKLDAFNVSNTVNGTTFSLGKRLSDANLNAYRGTEKLLAGILSNILNTNLKGTEHVDISATTKPSGGVLTPYKYALSGNEYTLAAGGYPQICWADYATGTNSPVNPSHVRFPLEEKLSHLYWAMTTIRAAEGELRAGSGDAVLRTVTDLWTVVNEIRSSEPLNSEEAVAKFFAERINLRIEKYFDAASKPADGNPVTGVTFDADLLDNFKAELAIAAGDGPVWPSGYAKPSNVELGLAMERDLEDFPHSFNLPRGGAHMTFNTTHGVFEYVTAFNTSGMGGVGSGSNYGVQSYFYPAELVYFGNSPLLASSTEHKTSTYPQNTTEWNKDTNWAALGFTSPHVEASTRSVAMRYDINYGNALLETKVSYKTLSLSDNNHAVQVENNPGVDLTGLEPDKTITVASDESFLLTGIIVGGQPENVGWDYLMKDGSKDGFIYDRAISPDAKKIPTTGSSVSVYTAVFDNYVASATQNKVYVALEFQNNTGEDFYGNHALVRDGGYFYLIGELDPAKEGLAAITWPTYYKIPPYNADGTSKEITRVFIQDYKTTVNFKLGANSLKYAYLTVPDLRSSSLTLGLSVDIEWSTGLNFDDVILGGN